jgi:phosphoribosylformimino-5-aminoimidazole carboxamide ribotide isomerase
MPAFEVIPVVDLMGGVVVHARAGERDRYRPLEGSRLCASAAPEAVVAGQLALHPFRRLYIADLDAIRRQGGHAGTVAELARAFPGLELWVDAGVDDARGVDAALAQAGVRPVLGSESQTGTALLESLRSEPRLVLSLDRRGAEPLGPRALLEQVELWPADVIVMTLARVGSGAGPDLAALREVLDRAQGRRVWAAGGVRDAADLAALRDLGCAGALVATALHDGRLTREDLARLG